MEENAPFFFYLWDNQFGDVPAEANRIVQGITDNLIRFSVGIEDVPDIQNDIEQAFNKCK